MRITHASRFFISLLLSLCLSASALAGTVSISGMAPSYAGKHLTIVSYADYISRLKTELADIEVGQDGSFDASFEIKEVTYAFVELGSFVGYIYLEPDVRYQVTLPRFTPKADADRFNPFFRPYVIELNISGATSTLNRAIRDFDHFFNREFAAAARRIVRTHDKKLAESLMSRLDSAARSLSCDKLYFKNHVRYRKAQVFAAPRLSSPAITVREFFAGRPVLYNLPAYWDVLDMMQIDPSVDLETRELRDAYVKNRTSSSPSFSTLSTIIGSSKLWASEQGLREALLLKNFQQQFYSRAISDGKTDTLLVSAARECHNPRGRMIAANIYAKKNKLRQGLPAPEIGLIDNADHEVNLSNYKGRFLYLCFMHTDNFECIKAMPALDNLGQLHRADMDILCVFTNEQPADAFAYVEKNRFQWKSVSFISRQRIIFDYEVRALPTYFLIDPDGCIALAEAPGPTEKVGPAIAAAIRKYILEQKRGKPEIPRTIYDIAQRNY
ncbi:MAG: redoxin domain-containing protein [Bacteroidales bacterium]|nr:redoxin domain-containing protein [Bacteroidales bacterium]